MNKAKMVGQKRRRLLIDSLNKARHKKAKDMSKIERWAWDIWQRAIEVFV